MPSSDGLLAIYPHITARDRRLMQLLHEHQVLTSDQVATLYFQARRTCLHRLAELRALELLDRFRFFRAGGGTDPYHWVLGHTGRRFQAAAHGLPEPTARASRQARDRLAASPNLSHLLMANEFFVRLAQHTRRRERARLWRWWSERLAHSQFTAVQPDGHGLWEADGRMVGFFLEADTGSESLMRVVSKLDAYRRLANNGGPRYPVLFWLSNSQREEHLHQLLREFAGAVPTATATAEADPAGAVWLPGDGHDRRRLHELPSDHGAAVASNPNFPDGFLDLGAGISF